MLDWPIGTETLTGRCALLERNPPIGPLSSSHTPSRSWSLFLYFAGQAIAAATLLFVPTSHALYLVAGMGLLLAPQALLLVYAGESAEKPSYLRRAAPFVMVSMAIAAWVV